MARGHAVTPVFARIQDSGPTCITCPCCYFCLGFGLHLWSHFQQWIHLLRADSSMSFSEEPYVASIASTMSTDGFLRVATVGCSYLRGLTIWYRWKTYLWQTALPLQWHRAIRGTRTRPLVFGYHCSACFPDSSTSLSHPTACAHQFAQYSSCGSSHPQLAISKNLACHEQEL